MIECNWDPKFHEKLTHDDSSKSWSASDVSVSQGNESEGALELNVGVNMAVCTCRTIELFSPSGYLKSIRGNLIEDEQYELYEHEIEPETVRTLNKAKFLSNSHSPKSIVFFRKLVVSTASPDRQSPHINTTAVREILKDLPHNEQSSNSVLSMMDNMPPFLSAMLPNNMNRLPPQLTSLHRPPLDQSAAQNQNYRSSENEQPSRLPDNIARKLEKLVEQDTGGLSSILGSIGSLQNVAALTDVFKEGKLAESIPSNDLTSMSSSEIGRLHAEQKAIKDDISKLRNELGETKRDLLQAVTDSEARTTELLLRVLEEIKTLHP